MIVDTHVHVASADTERYPVLAVPAGETRWWLDRLPVATMLGHMDRCGVDQVVLVHAFGAYGNDCRYVVEAVGADLVRARAVVGVDPAVAATMAAARQALDVPGVAGIRVLAIGSPVDAWVDDGTAEALWVEAGRLGRPIVVCARGPALARLRPTVAAHPGVEVVIDDCGVPELDDGHIPGEHPVFSYAELAHVSVKIFSPMLMAAARHGADTALVDLMVGHFGADRVAWGSNFPQSGVADYADLVDAARRATAALSASDRDAVLGDTARRLWFAATG